MRREQTCATPEGTEEENIKADSELLLPFPLIHQTKPGLP